MARLNDLVRLYEIMDSLREKLGGWRSFADPRSTFSQRGVYFFFEQGEVRSDSGAGMRIVRVGTHALTSSSRSTLRRRLMQHRGDLAGTGNHRGSIFRLLTGQALLARSDCPSCNSWGIKGDATIAAKSLGISRAEMVGQEKEIERMVSSRIRMMPFLWLPINDAPSPTSLRGFIERNSIALLSNYGRKALDPPSGEWLGHCSNRHLVRDSGLWNQRHVAEMSDPSFLDVLDSHVAMMQRPVIATHLA